jgi:hypothetical protein
MSGWNVIPKEVTYIEVDERMIYLLQCICMVTIWSKNIRTEKL